MKAALSFSTAIYVLLVASLLSTFADSSSSGDASILPSGSWTEHGFDASDKEALNDRLEQSVRNGEVPGGAVLIMHGGEVIFHSGFGWANLREQTPFKQDAPFRAASLTKPVLATLVVALDAKGVLDLDQSIDHWLPKAKELRRTTGKPPATIPTLRQCLCHTSGFRGDYSVSGVRPWLTLKHQGLTLAEVVDQELAIPMARDPGVKFAYSGIGFDVVGRVVEVATDRPIEDVLQQELWQPLGMTRTTLYPTQATLDAIPDFYWLHRSDGGFRRRLDRRGVAAGTYTPLGGGMVTTVSDLARFLSLHRDRGGALIESTAIAAMVDPQPKSPTYGLGFKLEPPQANTGISHTGSSGTMFWFDRDRDVIGVIATQHKMSDGAKKDQGEWVIPATKSSWTRRFKRESIDPIFNSKVN